MVKTCGEGLEIRKEALWGRKALLKGEKPLERERCSRDGRNPEQDTSPVKIHMPCERKKPCEMERHS